MTQTLRVIGDVHAQIGHADLFTRGARPYLEIIADDAYSIQLGHMGDGEAYAQPVDRVDAGRHRFFPGNHDHYTAGPNPAVHRMPPHPTAWQFESREGGAVGKLSVL